MFGSIIYSFFGTNEDKFTYDKEEHLLNNFSIFCTLVELNKDKSSDFKEEQPLNKFPYLMYLTTNFNNIKLLK